MSLLHGPKKPPKVDPPGSGVMDKAKSFAKGKAGIAGVGAIGIAEELIGKRFDPAPGYLFTVSFSGLMVAMFTSCEGLQVSRAVEEVQEGGLNDHVHSLPGPITCGRITLKRGLSVSRVLWDWFEDGLYNLKVKRENISITQGAPGMNLMGVAIGKPGPGVVKQWDIEGAFPVSWSVSGLDVSNTTSVAIESIEIAFETISLSKIVGIPLSPMALIS